MKKKIYTTLHLTKSEADWLSSLVSENLYELNSLAANGELDKREGRYQAIKSVKEQMEDPKEYRRKHRFVLF